jgi:hypothetical protein
MKPLSGSTSMITTAFVLTLVNLLTLPAWAQRVPLPVERTAPVLDEFAEPMNRAGNQLVHVLAVGAGIQPPNPFTGEPHPDNAILFTTKVGAGIHPSTDYAGFAVAITPRPVEPFFIRVYNSATTSGSTFYEDSDVFMPEETVDATFTPQVTATTNPVNPSVTADGITVSLKQSLGLNPYTLDTDGDGINDRDELRMGTDAVNAASRMPPVIIYADDHQVVNAVWDVSGADEAIMQAAGLSDMQQAELLQLFGNVPYLLEKTESLGAPWSEVEGSSGAVHQGWPVLPESAEGLQYIRMRMNP